MAPKCSHVNSMYICSLHTDISYYGLLFLCRASMLQLSAIAFLPTSLIWHLMMVESGCSIRVKLKLQDILQQNLLYNHVLLAKPLQSRGKGCIYYTYSAYQSIKRKPEIAVEMWVIACMHVWQQ